MADEVLAALSRIEKTLSTELKDFLREEIRGIRNDIKTGFDKNAHDLAFLNDEYFALKAGVEPVERGGTPACSPAALHSR